MESAAFESFYCDVLPFWEKLPQGDKEEICRHSVSLTFAKGAHVHDGGDCSRHARDEVGCRVVSFFAEK